jgi:Domain of unknown function (DUF1707)/Domain of unknown function (DUF4190)
MAGSPGYGMTPAAGGQMRASTADRERAVDVLKAGFVEGRLTKDEYDARVSQAYAARTYAELAMVTADLPGGQMAAPYPPSYLPYRPAARRTNGLAVASLVCGLAQPFAFGLTMPAAIILGHVARRQIRRTGEDGKGLATAALVLGWIGLSFALLVVLLIIIIIIGSHSPIIGTHTSGVSGHAGP